jgi:hypothetical protein
MVSFGVSRLQIAAAHLRVLLKVAILGDEFLRF